MIMQSTAGVRAFNPMRILGRPVYIVFAFLILMALLMLYFTAANTEMILKLVLTLIALSFFILVYLRDRKLSLFFVICSIPFPIHLQFMDKDAFTVTTLLIFILFSLELIRKKINFLYCGGPVLATIILFLIAYTISIARLPIEYLMVNARHYLGFLSSLMLFFIAVNIFTKHEDFVKLLVIIIMLLFIQILVSILVLIGVNMSSILDIFATRTAEFTTFVTERPGGIIDDYELLAEWFAMYIPFAIAGVYVFKKRLFWLIAVVLLAVGLLLAKTRGAIISVGAGMVVFMILAFSGFSIKQAKYVLLTIFIIAVCWLVMKYVAPTFYNDLMERFAIFFTSYEESAEFSELINRRQIWDNYLRHYFTLSFVGTGLKHPLGGGSLHSLYFTLLFQTGIMGLLSFVCFILLLLFKKLKFFFKLTNAKARIFMSLAISSVVIFLLDQVKVEFQRAAYFSQFTWLFFAMIILVRQVVIELEASEARETGT